MSRKRIRKKNTRNKKNIQKKPPFWKYAITGAILVAGIGYYSMQNKNSASTSESDSTAVSQRAEQSNNAERPGLKIPPAKIRFTRHELPKAGKSLEILDSVLESRMEKIEENVPIYSFGSMDAYPDFLEKTRADLSEKGIHVAEEGSTPKEIFNGLFDQYMQNNVWLFVRRINQIRNGERIGQIGGLMRYPVIGKSSLSYSYFNGKMSHDNVPILLLDGIGIPEQGELMAGLALKRAVVLFPDQSRWVKCSRDGFIHDTAIHEGIHYRTMELTGDWPDDEFDSDLNADTPEPESVTHARQMDEVRAYLIQTMYGKCPAIPFKMMWSASDKLEQYSQTKEAIWDSIDHVLSHNPGLYSLYQKRMLPIGLIPEKELRLIAHDAFLKSDLFYRSD